jgi:hypothetical protein
MTVKGAHGDLCAAGDHIGAARSKGMGMFSGLMSWSVIGPPS